jgi:ribosome silencing factor RsfS/YbeB/iojap
VERSLDDDKALDVTVIDLSQKTVIADYMVIASGTSKRQIATMAEHLARKLKDKGYGSVPIEGQSQGDWVLIDAGDVVVHLFRPELRAFYNLERLWEIPEPGVRTGESHVA